MPKKYESWDIELLNDFWNTYYPGVPRTGNATESKCRSIEREIEKSISSSSLYNYFNEKGSPPTDSTKGIMSYFIIKDWKDRAPDKFHQLQINGNDLNLKEAPSKYLMMYRRLKYNDVDTTSNSEENTSFGDEIDYFPIRLWQFPLFKMAILACSLLAIMGVVWLGGQGQNNFSTPDESVLAQMIDAADDLFLISILHVMTLILLMVIYYMPYGGRGHIEKVDAGYVKTSLEQFNQGWVALWISWISLYVWMSYKWIREKQLLHAEAFKLHAHFSEQSWAIADIINVMSTICFAYLFCIMDMKTVSTKENNLQKGTFYNAMLVIVLTAACFLMFSILDRFFNIGNLDGAGTLVYSFLTSIAMLYFFGRLDSHLFEAKRSLLAPLYLYAVIQVNWTNFRSAEFATQGLIIFFVAFLLKIYFFFIVNGWLRNGDFARYFARIRVLQKEVTIETKEQQEKEVVVY